MPSSPWLALAIAPPVEGAFGWITNIHSPIFVEWVNGGKVEAVNAQDLLQYKWTSGGLPDRGADVGVFDVVKGASLVWGNKGWAWALPNQPDSSLNLVPNYMNPIQGAIEDFSGLSKAGSSPNPEGYSFVVGSYIQLNRSMRVFEQPDSDAKALGTISATWPGRGALWREPWSDWQSLQSAGNLPSMANVRFMQARDASDSSAAPMPDSANAFPTILRVHQIQGDWVQVSAPERGTSIISIDNGHNAADMNPGYLVHWTASPIGWIRWAQVGPVPGTRICVVDEGYVGVVD